MQSLKILVFCMLGIVCSSAADRDISLDTLAQSGHWKQIRHLIQQQAPASEAEKAYWSARVKHAFGDLEDAEALVRKAISLDGRKSAYHLELSSICVDQLSRGQGMFASMHLAHTAKGELETALSLDPRNVDAMQALMDYYWNAPGIGGGDKKSAREMA